MADSKCSAQHSKQEVISDTAYVDASIVFCKYFTNKFNLCYHFHGVVNQRDIFDLE